MAAVIAAWTNQLAQGLCAKYAACCGADAATFDMAKCVASSQPGYDDSNQGTTLAGNGNVVFNGVAAQACLNDLNLLDCTTNQLTSAESTALFQDCYASLTGTLPNGSACLGSIECAPGGFCDFSKDGGVVEAGVRGTCEALRSASGPCGNFGQTNTQQAQEACSYRGGTGSNLTCQWGNFMTGNEFADAAAWTCIPEQALDASCNVDNDCTSRLCDPSAGYTCTSAKPIITMPGCVYYAKDGG